MSKRKSLAEDIFSSQQTGKRMRLLKRYKKAEKMDEQFPVVYDKALEKESELYVERNPLWITAKYRRNRLSEQNANRQEWLLNPMQIKFEESMIEDI